jgi:hypothetical protein
MYFRIIKQTFHQHSKNATVHVHANKTLLCYMVTFYTFVDSATGRYDMRCYATRAEAWHAVIIEADYLRKKSSSSNNTTASAETGRVLRLCKNTRRGRVMIRHSDATDQQQRYLQVVSVRVLVDANGSCSHSVATHD